MAHQQAKEKEEETLQEPGVKPVMLHRLSTSPPTHGKEVGKGTKEDVDFEDRSSRTTSKNKELQDQIDRQFSIVSDPIPPQTVQPSFEPIQKPRIRRITREEAMKKAVPLSRPPQSHCVEEDSEDDLPQLVPPLQIDKVSYHDGKVHSQTLEDTTGVVVSDHLDILIPKGKMRQSIENFWDSTDGQATPMTPPTNLPSPGHCSNSKSLSPTPSDLLALRVRTLLSNF